jgi:NAD(P)-dependent dehydrogenase (short-subunit alcohol dehydrogenase family)
MKSRSVLITGAGRGFGYALVEVFLAGAWTVFPLVRQEKDAARLKTMQPDRCTPIVSDVTAADLAIKAAAALGDCPGLDLLINNAGMGGVGKSFAATTTDELETLFRVHCAGAFNVIKAVMPNLQKSPNPIIINVSSRLGSMMRNAGAEFKGKPFSYSYRIAKAAQNMLTLCLLQEFGDQGIDIYAIHPGELKTANAAYDATREPKDAALKLMEWLERDLPASEKRRYVDLFRGPIPW